MCEDRGFDPGALSEHIEIAVRDLRVSLPKDYLDFVRDHNGGWIVTDDIYVHFRKIGELKQMNANYGTDHRTPELFLFGDNGSGEGYAFDMRSEPWKIVQVPFIGLAMEDAWTLADSFSDFIRGIDSGELRTLDD